MSPGGFPGRCITLRKGFLRTFETYRSQSSMTRLSSGAVPARSLVFFWLRVSALFMFNTLSEISENSVRITGYDLRSKADLALFKGS